MPTPISRLLTALAMMVAGAVAVAPCAALAQNPELSGKEVVDAVCASCHAQGLKGAPKIGDHKAWAKRSSRGLSSLTESAIKGIRDMPAHGGNRNLTSLEIQRGITYMVNQSGGKWTEPISKKSPPAARSGEQIVKAQCGKCHQEGKGGAPKIGSRDDWTPRLKDGLDHTVHSAIKGHGGMPARGGMADLTDAELRGAILYMFRGQDAK